MQENVDVSLAENKCKGNRRRQIVTRQVFVLLFEEITIPNDHRTSFHLLLYSLQISKRKGRRKNARENLRAVLRWCVRVEEKQTLEIAFASFEFSHELGIV